MVVARPCQWPHTLRKVWARIVNAQRPGPVRLRRLHHPNPAPQRSRLDRGGQLVRLRQDRTPHHQNPRPARHPLRRLPVAAGVCRLIGEWIKRSAAQTQGSCRFIYSETGIILMASNESATQTVVMDLRLS